MEACIARLEEFAIDAKERLARIEARQTELAAHQSELAAHQSELANKVGALQVEMHKGFADMIKPPARR